MITTMMGDDNNDDGNSDSNDERWKELIAGMIVIRVTIITMIAAKMTVITV